MHNPEKKTEIVFFLDAYDELPPSALWKNLWRTNTLSQFRARAEGKDKAEGLEGVKELKSAETSKKSAHLSSSHFPKVLITVRSELLSGRPDYQTSFLPIECQNEDKDEAKEVRNHLHIRTLNRRHKQVHTLAGVYMHRHEHAYTYAQTRTRIRTRTRTPTQAVKYFRELRFTPFGDKREMYQEQFVALDWRNLFGHQVAPKLLAKPFRRSTQFEFNSAQIGETKLDKTDVIKIFSETFKVSSIELARDGNAASTVNESNATGDNNEINNNKQKDNNETSNFITRLSNWFKTLHKGNTSGVKDNHWDRAVSHTAILAATAGLEDSKDRDRVDQFLKRHTANGPDETWTAYHYSEQFGKIPELNALTNTPFMVQIVTKILPRLSAMARDVSEIKSLLVIQLGEAVADAAWAALGEQREDVKGSEGVATTIFGELNALQQALDLQDANNDDKKKWHEVIHKLSQDITSRVIALMKKTPAEWEKPGALPDGCKLAPSALYKEQEKPIAIAEGEAEQKEELAERPHGVVEQEAWEKQSREKTTEDAAWPDCIVQWENKMSAVIERALLRSLRRQPTRRVDIYDQFVDLYFERAVQKSMGLRGSVASPQQLKVEVGL